MTTSIILTLLSLLLATACLVMVVILFKRHKSHVEDVRNMQNTLSQLDHQVRSINQELHEIRSGNFAVNKRVKQLVGQFEELQSAQQTFVEHDPQSRFYSKGAKLISQGASKEDVMRECEIPAAEAELLFNLHKQK